MLELCHVLVALIHNHTRLDYNLSARLFSNWRDKLNAIIMSIYHIIHSLAKVSLEFWFHISLDVMFHSNRDSSVKCSHFFSSQTFCMFVWCHIWTADEFLLLNSVKKKRQKPDGIWSICANWFTQIEIHPMNFKTKLCSPRRVSNKISFHFFFIARLNGSFNMCKVERNVKFWDAPNHLPHLIIIDISGFDTPDLIQTSFMQNRSRTAQ
jgi:hypothetical protein